MSDLLHVPGPDDRTVEVLVGGDPDGYPVLYHGGSPSAVAEYPPMDATARDLGLRLVTYSRPGYGASTPRPAAGAYADDVTESTVVLDHLGIGEFLTFGWSGGGPGGGRTSIGAGNGATCWLSDGGGLAGGGFAAAGAPGGVILDLCGGWRDSRPGADASGCGCG